MQSWKTALVFYQQIVPLIEAVHQWLIGAHSGCTGTLSIRCCDPSKSQCSPCAHGFIHVGVILGEKHLCFPLKRVCACACFCGHLFSVSRTRCSHEDDTRLSMDNQGNFDRVASVTMWSPCSSWTQPDVIARDIIIWPELLSFLRAWWGLLVNEFSQNSRSQPMSCSNFLEKR